MQQLFIYRSSAGSGKTHTLARSYVVQALQRVDAFKHILAITFTRKATAEMKRRILSFLVQLAADSNTSLKAEVAAQLPEHIRIPERARAVLHAILHQYSYLGVQTMESFFYQVVRAFEHELHLQLGAQLELKAKPYMDLAAERVLNEAGSEPTLTRWLEQMVQARMDEARNYELMQDLSNMGMRVLMDTRNEAMLARLQQTDVLAGSTQLLQALRQEQARIAQAVQRMATQLMNAIENDGYTVAHFAYTTGGVAGFVQGLALGGTLRLPTQRAVGAVLDTGSWLSNDNKKKFPQLLSRIATSYQPQLAQLVDFLIAEMPMHTAAQDVMKHLYMLPLLARMQHHLKDIRAEYGVLFMADVANLLHAVVDESTVPFVYEKIGVRYHHFLLDEFQDTASRQWHNLRPLLANNLAQGQGSLVVGDAKQSIYRWRGADAALLHALATDPELAPHQASIQSLVLDVNRRSGQHIVAFNNWLYASAMQVLLAHLGDAAALALQAFTGADAQQDWLPAAKGRGYVSFEGIAAEKTETEASTYKDLALARTLITIEQLLAQGYAHGDIAILTRTNAEATLVAEQLLAAPHHYPVASAEALLLSSSPRVSFLLAVFERLCYPQHSIAEAQLRLALQRMLGLQHMPTLAGQLQQPELTEALASLLQARTQLLRLALPELCQALLLRLAPHVQPDAYVLRFQDVLLDYAHKEGGQLMAFVAWWAQHGHDYKLANAQDDAIQVITLHKAKGLEYPVVILPFCNWSLVPESGAFKETLIWASSQQAPFDTLPVLPIAAKASAESWDVFYAAHQQELLSSYQDNLNLLYVATTRARQRLYGFYPIAKEKEGKKERKTDKENEKQDKLTTVAHLLAACWQQPQLQPHFDAQLQQLVCGQPDLPSTTVASAPAPLLPVQVVQDAWQQRLVIRPRAGQFEQLLNAKLQQQQTYGELLHQVLASITEPAHVNHALAQARYAGLLAQADVSRLTTQVQQVLALPQLQAWMDGSWQHLTEATLLQPGGGTLRPDRVLLRGGQAVVIDYKTGQPLPQHHQQVSGYMRALQHMGYAQPQGYLLYTTQAALVAVDFM